MIQITIPNRGIIHLPIPPADDANSIQGRCAHGESLLADCVECQDCEQLIAETCAAIKQRIRHDSVLAFWQNRSELFF